MKFCYLISIFFYHLIAISYIYGQPIAYDNLKFEPTNPEPGKPLEIEYTPIATLFSKGVHVHVFFNRVFEKWPRAIEIPMEKTGEKFTVVITPSLKDVSLFVVFVDSLGNVLDNNNDLGYWSPLYQRGESIPGSLASIANMYFGVALADFYKIRPARDLAKKLYEQDFKRKPELKRFYYQQYISTIREEVDFAYLLNELNSFSSLDDLTGWEIFYASTKYKSLGDTVKVNELRKSLLDKDTLGEWAFQQASLEYQYKYRAAKSGSERIAIMAEHYTKMLQWPMTEDNLRYLEVMGTVVFLSGSIEDYIKMNRLDDWKVLAANYLQRPYAKYYLYYFVAKYLNTRKIFTIHATGLAKEAVEWREQSLDDPRILTVYTDYPFLNDREVRFNREKQLSEWLEVYANSLRLQGKNEEARATIEKANLYSRHETKRLQIRRPVTLTSLSTPNIILSDSNKNEVNLKKYRGQVIVLDFWASWCGPCLAGFKKMNELEKEFSEKKTKFLFINTMEKGGADVVIKRALGITKREGYNFDVLFDPQSQASAQFGFEAIPTIIIIDKEGLIRYKVTGLGDGADIQSVISQLTTNEK